ncbi:MAG: PadR family transcriptional regulator [Candidatus Aminicenantes bacterium]|nr:PadR family transcriptional regulator [Candidatus Aminicenantes bacterium]
MKLLSRAEEIILLAVLALKDNAYGLSIRDVIRDATGDTWSLAQIYDPLYRLTRNGFLRKERGPSSPERGGRHKCLYSVTRDGKSALKEIKRVQKHIGESIPDKSLER